MKRLLLFLIVVLVACNLTNYSTAGGFRPRFPRFKFKGKLTSADAIFSKLDTSSIYITTAFDADSSKFYPYYRFFNTGQVFFGISDKYPPDEKAVNNFDSGNIGYYSIDGDNIKIETFTFIMGANNYKTEYGVINSDGIHLNKYYIKGSLVGAKKTDIYLKKYSIHLTGKPDW